MKARAVILTFLLALAGTAVAGAGRGFTIADARIVLDAAIEHANRIGAPGGTIAIVDAGGALMLLERLDGTFAASAAVSEGKARTAALFGKPTRVFEDAVNHGRTAMVTVTGVTGFTPLQGGVPIEAGGRLVAAIGVSGAASAAQDDEIAQAAVDAFAARRVVDAGVTRLDAKRVAAAFETGAPLFESASYKVHASRRDAPGEAEIHRVDTDIFYVLDGRAELVTGGRIEDARDAAPAEVRGPSITGGTTRELAKGDVIVIPAGVPHWFRTVSEPVRYYVVKSSRS
jgi:glc operon protein GlcG